MTSRPSTAATILAVLAIVLVPLGAYVGGYVSLGRYDRLNLLYGDEGVPFTVERVFPHRWMLTAFRPAAIVEAVLVGHRVHLVYEEPEEILFHPEMVKDMREREEENRVNVEPKEAP